MKKSLNPFRSFALQRGRFLWHFCALALLNAASTLSVSSQSLTPAWNVGPGERFYLLDDNAHRGMGVNPSTGNPLIVSRTGGPGIYALSGSDGSDVLDSFGSPLILSTIDQDGTPLGGGIFPISMIGIGSNGEIYSANLTLDGTTSPFKVYRWDSESVDAIPYVVFEGDPGSGVAQRWGDSFAVRGTGSDTQILLGSRAGKMFSVLTTANGTDFTANAFELPEVDGGAFGLGVAFGSGQTIWTKSVNAPLMHIEFDVLTDEATILHSFASPAIPNSVTAIGVDTVNNRLAGVALGTPGQVFLYDISDLSSGLIAMADAEFPVANANSNGTGAVGFDGDRLFALLTNNGIAAWDIETPSESLPPEISAQPTPLIVLEGASVSFQVGVTGTPPFDFQWFKDQNPIPGANLPNYEIAEAALADSGFYSVEISNSVGSVTSLEVELTVTAIGNSSVLKLAWSEIPGETQLAFIGTDNAQRGMAFNPSNNHLLLASRTGGAAIHVFDGDSGEYLHVMDTDPTFVLGGTFTLSLVGVAGDGAVYGSNLTLNGTTTPFTIYRWSSDDPSAMPDLAFEGDPGLGEVQRWGDTLAVRGSGVDTQILAASRTGTVVALFTTNDGINFLPTLLQVDGISGGNIGLGLAFGEGDTFWGNAAGANLRQFSFNQAAGTASVLNDIGSEFVPVGMSALGVDVENSMLAGILVESPDNVRLFDISEPASPKLIDQEILPSDQPNLNITGAVQFGAGRLFVLNTNNGIVAYDFNDLPDAAVLTIIGIDQSGFSFQISGSASASYKIWASASVDGPWSEIGEVTLDDQGLGSFSDSLSPSISAKYFRAAAGD